MKQPVNPDAEFCGRVPLHQTNSIQPHGVLLVLEKGRGNILQASENANAVFPLPAKELIGKSLTEFASAEGENLQALLQTNLPEKLPFELRVNNHRYTAVLQQQDDYLLLEVDLSQNSEGEPSVVSLFREIAALQTAVDKASTTTEACAVVAEELKRLSGFDKVMIYRFDEDWNGEVIAEAAADGMDRYLGLRFPASDIPKQARELYKKTPYRLIPAVDYAPVKLYPVLNPQTHGFTNLSNANLRSVAGVHLEYLRNMKVQASMSTRILVNGELWGLIACHHKTPHYLPYKFCAAFEILSGSVAAKISALQGADALAHETKTQDLLLRFAQAFSQKQNTKEVLLQLLEADGLAWVREGRVETQGRTPTESQIQDLLDWLSTEEEPLLHLAQLSAVYEPAETYTAEGSGLLALTLNRQRGDYLLFFRPEAVQKISWGGNPAEAVRFENDGLKYHPRASFGQWQQTVRNRAVPWSQAALQTAAQLQRLLPALLPTHS